MTNLRFPFQRLPDDICSKVLKTMEHHEIIAYSLTSKKALAMVKYLRIPLEITSMKIGLPQIRLNFRHIVVVIKLRMSEDDEEMTSLEDIPISTNVSTEKTISDD